MAHLTKDKTGINARIVYWGIPGAGVSTNLQVIHDKLRANARGELSRVPTRLDPTAHYEVLPIELGQVNGLGTRLEVVGVPGGPEHAPTRKQLLDHIDGLVLVIDAQPNRVEENVASLAELDASLAAYGRSLDELPIVVQYNKTDLSDPYVTEELHRRLGLGGSAVFEGVATEKRNVLEALTTISKRVIRVLRDADLASAPAPPAEARRVAPAQAPAAKIPKPPAPAPVRAPEPLPEPTPLPAREERRETHTDVMESAILAEAEGFDDDIDEAAHLAQTALDQPWDEVSESLKSGDGARIGADFEIVSVGTAVRATERAVRIPLVLGNPEGETVTLALTVQLDPLLDSGGE